MADQRYVIWGSAGHAKVLASLVAIRGGRVVALFDSDPAATSALPGVPLSIAEVGLMQWMRAEPVPGEVVGLVAIGGARGRDRLKIQALLRRAGLRMQVLLHPDASVCATAQIGEGSQVLARAVVAADARIGEGCIVNHGASVDHECVLGDGVHVAPGATLCGCVSIGSGAFIGAGAVVLPRLSIGEDVIIGAGAVVTRSMPPGSIVVGNPGRVVGSR